MSTDPRGILRGGCTSCLCGQYTSLSGAAKCSCGHPPAKHANLSASAGVPGAQYSQHGVSYGGSGFTPPMQHASGLYPHVPPTPLDLDECKATGCFKKVHYDHELGPFDYCSPECRDRHLLPIEQQKLKDDIARFSSNISSLSPLVQQSDEGSQDVKGPDPNDCVVLKKNTKEDPGIIVSTNIKGGLLITGVDVKGPAFKCFKKESIKFLDVIMEINEEPVTTPEAFRDSMWGKTQPRLKLKRHYNMPSQKKFIAEVESMCPSVTHIFVLSPQHIGSEQEFGFFTAPADQGAKIFIFDSLKSCASLSGITDSDVIKMYALVHNAKIGTAKKPIHDYNRGVRDCKEFEQDKKTAVREQNSLVLAVQRQTKY